MSSKESPIRWLAEQLTPAVTLQTKYIDEYVKEAEKRLQAFLVEVYFSGLSTGEYEEKEKSKDKAIAFHQWMKKNDTADNAERFFHYTDNDMYNEFLKESTLS